MIKAIMLILKMMMKPVLLRLQTLLHLFVKNFNHMVYIFQLTS